MMKHENDERIIHKNSQLIGHRFGRLVVVERYDRLASLDPSLTSAKGGK
jgi:hypothetical protein